MFVPPRFAVALTLVLVACEDEPPPTTPPAPPACAGDDRAPVPDGNGGIRCIETGASPTNTLLPYATADFAGVAFPSPVAYVRADAAPGGDGSIERPFAALAEALQSGASTLVLAGGSHPLTETLTIDRAITVVGAGVGASVVGAPDRGPALRIRAASVTLARVRFSGSAASTAPVLDVTEGATATLKHVLFDGGAAGARVTGATTQASFERVSVVRARTVGVTVEDGARARLVGVSVRDGAGLGVIAGASGGGRPGGRILVRESLIARNAAEGVTLTADGGADTGFQSCEDTLETPRGAFDCVALTAVQNNTGTGVYLTGRRTAAGRANVLSGTRARTGSPSGDGLFVGDGASIELDRALTGDARIGHGSQWVANARIGVLVSGAGAAARIHGASIRDNASAGVFVQSGATLDALAYSALERNGGVGLGAGEGATLGSILCDHFIATRYAPLTATVGRPMIADGVSVHRATVREMTACEVSGNGRFGLVLNTASGSFTRNRGQDNRYGLGNYAPASVTIDDLDAIRGREPTPATTPAVAVSP
jgi:hypothetical protein